MNIQINPRKGFLKPKIEKVIKELPKKENQKTLQVQTDSQVNSLKPWQKKIIILAVKVFQSIKKESFQILFVKPEKH